MDVLDACWHAYQVENMSKKYINANIQCFDSIGTTLTGNMIYRSDITTVSAKRDRNGRYIINGFCIVAFINIRGSANKIESESPLDQKRKLTSSFD